jgi:hypothetical protein
MLARVCGRKSSGFWAACRQPRKKLHSGGNDPHMGSAESLYDRIQGVTPKDDAHRVMQSHALSLAVDLGNTRWFFAPPNATVTTGRFVSAFSVSSAILLMLELYSPYKGWIQVSSPPLQAALERLGPYPTNLLLIGQFERPPGAG